MKYFAIALIAAASATKLQWGVKDLTDEQAALEAGKLSYEDMEKNEINTSLAEAEAESGHKLGNLRSTLPSEIFGQGKNKKFDNSQVLF